MDLNINKNHYGYIWHSMQKNIKVIKKIKKNKRTKFIFNYLKHKILLKDLKYIIDNFDKTKKFKDYIQVKNDYEKGILPTFIKMCHFCYYRNYLPKSFFKLKELLFFNDELLVIKYKTSLFINIRGTVSFKQLELFQNLSLYKKQFFFEEEINSDFLKWKDKLLEKYSIQEILKKKSISDRYLFHKGFIEIYSAYKIKSKILKILDNNPKIDTIYLNGHSLGGGLCTFLVLDLYEYYYMNNNLKNKKINITTFGAPGIMNSNLSLFFYYLIDKKFINKYIRIINKKDIISSGLTDPKYLFTRFTGLLRHFDASIPKSEKIIIKNEEDKTNKKILNINCEKYLNNFVKKKELSYTEIHSLFGFTNDKKGILFSI
tara:strand:- start:650 stop:1768 length:1119 start_codon:yes stop_codon:yes gene_type:complete